jgi:hypothetical protein
MRYSLRFAAVTLALAAGLVLSSPASAQTASAKSQQGTQARSPWKYYAADRAVGDGGPAPKRDLSGTWAGPRSGAGVPDGPTDSDKPSLTPLGQQLMSVNKPLGKFSPAGTNDPTVRSCDPFGVPRNAMDEIRALSFATMPGRIIMLIQFQDIWREIWMDGRKLPTTVGEPGKDALDPRYNGYSVGHWEDDSTLVIDTTGLDERTWITGGGLPHTMNAHIQERYTRVDHNDLKFNVTIDDPKVYTKAFSLGTRQYRWIPNQEMDEKLCVPSEVMEYLQTMGDPAGSDPNAAGEQNPNR